MITQHILPSVFLRKTRSSKRLDESRARLPPTIIEFEVGGNCLEITIYVKNMTAYSLRNEFFLDSTEGEKR